VFSCLRVLYSGAELKIENYKLKIPPPTPDSSPSPCPKERSKVSGQILNPAEASKNGKAEHIVSELMAPSSSENPG
jgi:hypothetical protein